jgi:SAM-dependent methyltransferase
MSNVTLPLRTTAPSLTELQSSWDRAADDIEVDPMRPVRYGKCLGLLRDLDRTSRLLEVGCGEGTGLRYAADLGFTNLTGCEISAERLRRATERVSSRTLLRLVNGSGELPFGDGEFDAVYSTAVIEHTLDPDAFLREIRRVVKPNGRVIISSDCWQWRVLQMLGFYRSVQPIDRAVTTGRMLQRAERCGFKVGGFDGFPLPGEEYRFLRMLLGGIVNCIPGKALSQRIVRRVFGDRPPAQQPPSASPLSTSAGLELFRCVASESHLAPPGWRCWLRSTFSDENVFLMFPAVAVAATQTKSEGN